MKKLIVGALLIGTMLVSCGCNYNMVDTKWDFNKAYISWEDGQEEVSIKSWSEDDTTFTIVTTDDRVICSSQVNIILVKD